MDLGLLVDSSSAVDWSKMQGLLKGYVRTRNISPDGDHVGIVTFASSSSVDLSFPKSSSPDYNKGRIWQAIDELRQQGGNDRRIDLGLETVSSGLFGSHAGARKDARQVKQNKRQQISKERPKQNYAIGTFLVCSASPIDGLWTRTPTVAFKF